MHWYQGCLPPSLPLVSRFRLYLPNDTLRCWLEDEALVCALEYICFTTIIGSQLSDRHYPICMSDRRSIAPPVSVIIASRVRCNRGKKLSSCLRILLGVDHPWRVNSLTVTVYAPIYATISTFSSILLVGRSS